MGRPWRVVVWDDETVDRVKRLVLNDGLCASQVASRLAGQFPGMTRNSVIGKLYRLGVFGRPIAERAPRPPRVRRARTSTPRKQRYRPKIRLQPTEPEPGVGHGKSARKKPAPPPPPAELRAPAPESIWITIKDLNFWTCRFPKGDPADLDTFRYCGLPSLGRAYCPHHCGLAYLPARAA